MAIAFVRTYHDAASFVTSKAVAVPASTPGGNLLVVTVIGTDTPTNVLDSCSDTKLNTYNVVTFPNSKAIANQGAMGICWSILTTPLTTSDTITPVVHDAGNGIQIIVSEFSGLDASPFDQVNNARTIFDTPHPSGNVTTTQNDELIFGAHTWDDAGPTWTPDASEISIDNKYDPFAFLPMSVQYRIVSSTGSYGSTGTTSGAAASQDQVVTFKAVADIPPPPAEESFVVPHWVM